MELSAKSVAEMEVGETTLGGVLVEIKSIDRFFPVKTKCDEEIPCFPVTELLFYGRKTPIKIYGKQEQLFNLTGRMIRLNYKTEPRLYGYEQYHVNILKSFKVLNDDKYE